jgi:hypothetical protein
MENGFERRRSRWLNRARWLKLHLLEFLAGEVLGLYVLEDTRRGDEGTGPRREGRGPTSF